MPAYQLHIYEQQEEREALEQKICEQVDTCTEVNGKIRNRVKKFLIEEGITDISEMDVALRIRYEEYLERNETVHAPITCLRGFDRIFLHQMKEEMQTLAGRRNYTTEYRDQWICLTLLWSSIFVTLMANKIGGLQFGIYRNCQISSRVSHTAVAALPLTKANGSDFE